MLNPKIIFVPKQVDVAFIMRVLERTADDDFVLVLNDESQILKDPNELKSLLTQTAQINKNINVVAESEWRKSRMFAPKAKSPNSFLSKNTSGRISDLAEKKDKDISKLASQKTTLEKNYEFLQSSSDRVKKPVWNYKKIIYLNLTAALVILVLVFSFVLPKTDLVLEIKEDKAKTDFSVLGDSQISSPDLHAKKISAQLVKVDKVENMEFQATGKKNLEAKSHGFIIVLNSYQTQKFDKNGRPVPQLLVATTRFQSDSGKIFRLIKTIVLNPPVIEEGQVKPGETKVEVQAENSGSEYNIDPENFIIPGFDGTPKYKTIVGKSIDPMTSGAKGEVNVVSAQDLEKAKAQITNDFLSLARDELNTKLPKNLKLLPDAQEQKVVEFSTDKKVDEKADVFQGRLKLRLSALLFNEENVKSIAEAIFKKNLKENQKISGDILLSYSQIKPDFKKNLLSFKVHAESIIRWQVSFDDLKKKLIGRDENGIRAILANEAAIVSAKVNLWPFWIRHAPKDPAKIHIKTQN